MTEVDSADRQMLEEGARRLDASEATPYLKVLEASVELPRDICAKLGDLAEVDIKGPEGLSMLSTPGCAPGLTRSDIPTTGWLCTDTASLHFDQVRVPAVNLIGEEGKGFRMIMGRFHAERINIAALVVGFSLRCFDEALEWCRQRKTLGKALMAHPVVKRKLVDCAWASSPAAPG